LFSSDLGGVLLAYLFGKKEAIAHRYFDQKEVKVEVLLLDKLKVLI
jgi:hypothetical protein